MSGGGVAKRSGTVGRQYFRVADVANALERAGGVTTLAAQILARGYGSCTPQTVRNYLARYPKLATVVEQAIDGNLDLAESKLITAVGAGEGWAVKFYLESKGKHRGYTRRHEIGGINGQPIEVTDARDRLLAELAQMGERLKAAGNGEPRLVAGRANGVAGGNGANPTDPAAIKE